MKLITFAHAGGFGGYYYPLKVLEDEDLQVVNYEYAGHGARFHEPLRTQAQDVIQAAYDELFAGGLNEPVVLFGHSMGAYLCYELAYELQIHGQEEQLAGLILSGAAPPSGFLPCGVDLEDREAVLAYLAALGGTQNAVMRCEEFLELYLTVVTTDLGLMDHYTFRNPDIPYTFPIKLLYAEDDTYLPSPEIMEQWGDVTQHYLGANRYSGGHFYLGNQWDVLRRDIRQIMDEMKRMKT